MQIIEEAPALFRVFAQAQNSCETPQKAKQTAGNLCVAVTSNSLEYPSLEGFSDALRDVEARCVSFCTQRDSDAAEVSVKIYFSAIEVQLCVHGLFATASYWMQTLATSSLLLRNREQAFRVNKIAPPTTQTGEGVDTKISEQASDLKANQKTLKTQSLWLQIALPTIALSPAAIPQWLVELGLSDQVKSVAESAKSDGYLVVEFKAGTPLYDLKPFKKSHSTETSKAVIYVAVNSEPLSSIGDVQADATKHASVAMRYFAPQYGNDEDAATGSAARVVAAHFAKTFGHLSIEQQSQEGGWLYSQHTSDQIMIRGSVEYIAPPFQQSKATK